MAKRYPQLYQLHDSVGPGRPNRNNDVKLIQALMMALRGTHDVSPAVNIDGHYTAQLKEYVEYFQIESTKGQLAKDGIVSPMRMGKLGELLPTFSNGRISTLYALNVYLLHKNQAVHRDLLHKMGGITIHSYRLF